MTSKDIVDSVKERIQPHYKALSMDGSAFDSSQFAILQDIVENGFFRRIEDIVDEWVDYQCRDMTNCRDPREIAKAMKESLLSTTNIMYVTLPGIDDDEWTESELAEYRRETGDRGEAPWQYIARIVIKGTTFSGLSTRTTLGNTLRSIAYTFYYCLKAGIK
jgi:hypothetical protein